MADERPVDAVITPGKDNTQPSTFAVPQGSIPDAQEEFEPTPDQLARMEAEQKLTPQERAKRKAMLVNALERGVVHDRLKVDLPPHLHGEWVRADPMEIERLRTLGFWIDEEYAPARGLHSDGTGGGRIADVLFMVTSKENKELIDEVRHEQFLAINGKPGDPKASQREEKQFAASVQSDTAGIVPVSIESTTRAARKDDVAEALRVADNQTKSQIIR